MKKCLEKSGYAVPGIIAYGEQAIQKVAEFNPDLVLMDVMLKGDITGIEAAEEIINNFQIPVVYLTGLSDNKTLLKAKYTQPFGYVLKPFETIQLITTIEIALNKSKTEVLMRSELEKEKEISSSKTRFVSMVSHEFRNPLSTIFTSAELLANHGDKLTEAKKIEYLHFIQNSVKNLNHLITNILSISKAEIPNDKFNPKPIDLEAFCQNLVAEIMICTGDKPQIIFATKETNISPESQLLNNPKKLPCLDENILR
ncbi:MAG: hybrid sensor histidine kinase/response regulator, partial [Calothrix sp. SM1_7_51]|nr:hybrid sensor histidine kinase/response regulator [Calothrix sp. SM1_7_51]